MTLEEKKKIKEKLPHGWTQKVAEQTNLSVSYVTKVMSGQRESIEVEKEVISLASKYQEELNSLKEQKDKFLNQ